MADPFLSPAERRQLREVVVRELTTDADDGLGVEHFLPLPMHARALAPRILLVIGERGAGKTAMFEFLTHAEETGVDLTSLDGLGFTSPHPAQRWLVGHGRGREFPSELVKLDLADGHTMRWWWVGRLIQRLALSKEPLPALPPALEAVTELSPNTAKRTADLVAREGAAALSWLEDVDAVLGHQQRHLTVTYDYLDRIGGGSDLRIPAQLSASLISLWMDLRGRLDYLHGKIFLRNDLLERAAGQAVDGSKWQSHAVSLDWTRADLYRVLLRHLGRHRPLRAWLARPPDALPYRKIPHLGWLPSFALPEDHPQQQQLFAPSLLTSVQQDTVPTQIGLARKLAGATMGGGANKGYTHRWMINHIKDGHGRAVPRSLLNLVKEACSSALKRSAQEPPGLQLFWPSDLEQAKAPTGQRRIAELGEEHAVVQRLEALRGERTPFEVADIQALLSTPPERDDGLGEDGDKAMKLLLALGALYERTTRSRPDSVLIDMPELLRAALEIHRKGGVGRVEG